MHTLLTDNQITRNRKVHYVMDREDVVVFSAPALRDCLEWLQENEVRHFYIDFGDFRALMYLPSEPCEGEERIPGRLHRPKDEGPEDGASPQAAPQLVE